MQTILNNKLIVLSFPNKKKYPQKLLKYCIIIVPLNSNNNFTMLESTYKLQSSKINTRDTYINDSIPIEQNTIFFTIQDQSFFDDRESISQSRRTDSTYQYNFQPIIKGNLLKRTLNVSYCKRYFVLTHSRLLYFSTESMAQLKGCFNLNSLAQYNLQIQSNYPKIRLFIFLSQKRTAQKKIILRLKFEQQEIFYKWSQQLNRAIESLHEHKYYPLLTENKLLQSSYGKKNYWNKLFISNKQLSNYASNLDIVFFRSHGTLASFNRFLMRSNFDHVGLLFRNSQNKLHLFEAIESRGVWVSNWNENIPRIKDLYEEVGYRKLSLPNNYQIKVQILQQYLNTLLGKEYELSLSKLFSKNNLNDSSNLQQVKKQTYFCSQLVADIFMKFGILKEGRRNQFWPSHFEGYIGLQKGIYLGPMMTVQI